MHSPLKLTVDKLLILYCDVCPNEIYPAMNRSPLNPVHPLLILVTKMMSFCQDDSPKLHIPYGHVLQQYRPLIVLFMMRCVNYT